MGHGRADGLHSGEYAGVILFQKAVMIRCLKGSIKKMEVFYSDRYFADAGYW